MKARFACPLLFLLPAAMAAVVCAVVAGAAAGGLMWLYVYGDDTWPATAGYAVAVFAAVVFVIVLATLLMAAHAFGKHREALGGMSRQHVAFAVAASVLLPALVLLHQWQIGNLT